MRSAERRNALPTSSRIRALARRAPLALAALLAAFPSPAPAAELPLPPPPAGTVRIPQPSATERCTGCHAALAQGRILHRALEKNDCTACHRAITDTAGKCRSKTASKWGLVRAEPELCYGCHKRKDQQKSVHTAIRQGSCLSCHAPHSSAHPGLLRERRERICFDCHDEDGLVSKPVKHAPVMEGLCVDCHDPHGGNLPANVRAESGTALCLRCHDAKAPESKGSPGPAYRIDLRKPVVHAAFKRVDCLGCHVAGHGADRPKLLKKNPVDLCNGCHPRRDQAKFPHSAVVLGECVVCHDPHASDQPKLITRPTVQATCFLCHQDDLTGRKVLHAPVVKGCDQCHDPHGAANRFALKGGEGKASCYKCHKPVDGGKVKHAALERYGCTGCHDPHGTGHAGLLPKKVNALCVACHPQESDGRHVSPVLTGRSHPVDGNLDDPRRRGREFSCASCHNPHGSDNPRLFYLGATPMESCDGCHGDKSGKHPELKNIVSKARREPVPAAAGAAGGGPPGSGAGAPGVTP